MLTLLPAPRILASIVSSILAALLSTGPASAQMVGGQVEKLWQFDGHASNDGFGYSVSGAGDVDGDGFDDLIVGAQTASPAGHLYAGSAYVYSGTTGGLLWQFDGQASDDRLGSSVSGVGDLDGDGFDDVIVGASGTNPGFSNAGSAYVYSGATGSLIWQFDGQSVLAHMGVSVSGAGDVDRDGFDDVIVGAEVADSGGISNAGSAYVYSGATGSLLLQFDGQADSDYFGHSVSSAGDVDGDGLNDMIVGAWFTDPGSLTNAGSAYVYSLDPFLLLAEDSISYTGALPAQLTLSFPLSEAGMPYALLFSLEGVGPSVFQGIDIPLTQDSHFQLLLGNPNLHGVLDASAEAYLDLGLHQRTPPGAVGHSFHLAAVTLDPGTWSGRMSSVVRYMEVVP